MLLSGNNKSCGCSKRKSNKFDLTGKYGIGYTNKNEKFLFDLDDYNKIKDYSWYIDNRGYLRAKIPKSNGKITLMHWLVMNTINTAFQVDHINGCRTDNRKGNLRIANDTDLNKNSMNRKIQNNNTSGCPGVIWHKRDCGWEVTIGYKRKIIYLGRFSDYEKAVMCRKRAEEKYFGIWSYEMSRNGGIVE